MNTGLRSQCLPNYRILTENQIKEIHYETLQLLESTGVRVMDQEGVQILIDAGCRIVSNNIVQIPNRLVEDCIRSSQPRQSCRIYFTQAANCQTGSWKWLPPNQFFRQS